MSFFQNNKCIRALIRNLFEVMFPSFLFVQVVFQKLAITITFLMVTLLLYRSIYICLVKNPLIKEKCG